jgi:hypothetical protein
MKITADDWHFRPPQNGSLIIDVFLSNAQHALLQVNPMKDPAIINGQIPEMIVYCELLGEKIKEGPCPARWISRPPQKACEWSHVEIPPALMQQIKQKLGYV